MFFNSIESLIKIIILSVLFYYAMILILRISGKRTISDLNAFDFIVTVTMGSIASATILSDSTKLFDGIIALSTLVLLQYISAKLTVNYKKARKILESEPTLLYYDGRYLKQNMQKMRVSEDDLHQVVRLKANAVIEDVAAVVLEANGQISVVETLEDEHAENFLARISQTSSGQS